MLIKNLFRYWTFQVFSPGTVLREKYESFKALLEHDKAAHEFMATLEDYYYSHKKYDFQAVVKTYGQMARSVSHMVDELIRMCPSRYWDLKDYFKKFDSYNRFMLSRQALEVSPPFTIEFDKAALLNETLAGKKAFCLSNLNQKLHLPTPRGFVITTSAFHYFLEANTLHDPINQKLADLDISDPSSLAQTARHIEAMILNAAMPDDLARAVTLAMGDLAPGRDIDFRVALRSSAVKEDGSVSFAGLYETLLNVRPGDVLEGYKQIIASKYAARALYYRINHGILDDETPMAVLALEMIDSKASGVIYTRDLEDPGSDCLFIHSIQGLGEQLVDGTVSPDIFQVSRKDPGTIVNVTCGKKGPLSLDEASAVTLGRWGILLEDHFKEPQDIEWAQDPSGRLFILQSRPLNMPSQEGRDTAESPLPIENRRLCSAKESVCRGAAAGPVFRLENLSQASEIPDGSVVVTRLAPPQLVTAIHHMAAVVIETGSRASHFSSIAREFKVPAIVNVDQGVHDLVPGRWVTVDADHCVVYDGIAAPLTKRAAPGDDLFKESSFMMKLRYVINFSVQLKFTDPESDNFIPMACRSLHDIIRFTHETAMKEMFLSGTRKGSRKKGAKKLLSHLPMLFYVLDVGRGVKGGGDDPGNEPFIRPENIVSTPMKAVLKGLSHPGISWSETSHFDWEAYDRVVMAGGIISADSPQFGSYAVISKEYVNINFRFGYHFVILDAICSSREADNYILFRFSGGGGSPEGRRLRAGFIKGILTRLGFMVQIKSDLIDAQFKHAPQKTMKEILDMTGRLLGATKLMDMYLKETRDLEFLIDEFMNGRYDFRSTIELEPER